MKYSQQLAPHLLAISVVLALSPSAASAAQSEKAPPSDEEIETITISGRYTVSENVDTATGLGLTLQETPQSVSIITSSRIQDQALDTIVDTVLNAPGVARTEVDNVRNTLSSRGFEITNYQIDGVPLSWSLAADSGETIQDVSIYERVEFVRGATGLLTGVGDPSASINLVRKKASMTELTGHFTAAAGRWKNHEFQADVANGLNSDGSLRGRFVAKYEAGESYEDYFEQDTTVLYGVLEQDLGYQTLLRVGASYQNNDPTSPTWGALPSFYTDGSKIKWDRSKSTAADWTRWETTGTNIFANLEHSLDNGWQLKINYNHLKYEQETRLLYLFGAMDRETGSGIGTSPLKSDGDSIQDSVDIQLQGDYPLFARHHEFVLGALYSEQSADTLSYAALTNVALPVENFYNWDSHFPQPEWADTSTVSMDLDTTQKGLYAATRVHVSDAFKVIAGARLASWQREGVSYGTPTDFGDDGELIPYLGALYDISDQHRLYASYTSIFQPQNAQDRNGEFLEPVEGTNIEVGLKSRFLDDRLHTAVSFFKIEQDNLAQPDIGFEIPGNPNSQASFAAEGATSEGFEIEIVGQPVEGWNIHAGYSYFDAEDANDVAVNTDQPRKQLKLFTTYQFVDTLPELTIGGGVNWQDEIYSINGSNRLEQDAYALTSLMARYAFNDNLNAQLNVNNLFDETYYTQIGFFNQYRYGTPRNMELRVTYSF